MEQRKAATIKILENFIKEIQEDIVIPEEFSLEEAPVDEGQLPLFRISLVFTSDKTAQDLQRLLEDDVEIVVEEEVDNVR